jgi:AbrB family looped-hinge helix DNA binding protein
MAIGSPEPSGPRQPGGIEDLFYGSATVGERGQIVIPAEARKRHGLVPGDKLLVFRHPHIHGVVLARLDDVQALLQELQQWVDVVAEIQRAQAAPEGETAERRSDKDGHGR